MGSQVLLGDGLVGLALQRDVGLIFADLPSGETRAEFDKKPDMQAFWSAAWEALSPDGNIVLMASSLGFANELVASQVRFFRYDIIWHKGMATGFLNAGHRPLRAHEFILIFNRGKKATYNPQMQETAAPIRANQRQSGHGENYGQQTSTTKSRAGAKDRFPRSVWSYKSVGTSSADRTHPQQKPELLLRNIIKTYSNTGDLVVDPYAGSGSTGRAALAEKRRFIGWDNSPRFGDVA